jgi:hypothetical protein
MWKLVRSSFVAAGGLILTIGVFTDDETGLNVANIKGNGIRKIKSSEKDT